MAEAAIVETERTEAAIDSLRAEGVYDPSRRIEPYGDEYVAIPIVGTPTETPTESVRTVELPRRKRGLEDVLESHDVDDEIVEAAPSSWAVIGSVVLVDFGDVSADETLDRPARQAIGEALLELHAGADTVLARGGISGTRRDPSGEIVAGVDDTETVHVEHGTKYAIDLSKTMFSPGNQAERVRMGSIVEPGERVFDMFAGIGYFTLPMARSGAIATAAEIDPEAYRFLVENAKLNGVSSNVRAVLGDCRTVETTADRVVMGYYDAYDYLESALEALVDGGVLHLHEATPEPLFPDRPIARLRAATEAADRTLEVLETHRVKSHSAGVVHGVVDATIE